MNTNLRRVSELSFRLLQFFLACNLRRVKMANSVRKPRTKFSDANLVLEALEHKLNVLEDPPLISLLGREKFVELAIFGRLG